MRSGLLNIIGYVYQNTLKEEKITSFDNKKSDANGGNNKNSKDGQI